MKIATLIAVALVILSSIPLMAQQAGATTQQSTSATAAGTHVNESTSGTAMATEEMRPVNGELVGKLDSKSAKTGDRVVVKTTERVQTANGAVIPKGSRLVGHITEVQPHGSGHPDSQMGIEFDRAELKGGQNLAIHSVIQSVSAPASAIAASSMDDDAMGAPMAPMGGGAMAGGGRADGGMLGRTAGGALGGAASSAGQLGAGMDSAAGGAARATGNVAGDATAGARNGVHGAADAAGTLGAHATGIPGVMLEGGAAGAASGTLSAAKRNVHLDSGTQMVLAIATADKP